MKLGALALLAALAADAGASTCFGSVSRGRLEGGVALPLSGANFSAYSSSILVADRRFVHAQVAGIVLDAYAALRRQQPDLRFMYGETGHKRGGPFEPHRTHQNGLSVDFFVPVRDAGGQPALLPTALGNRFGYDLEFDADGRQANYRIDFDALAAHLVQLHRAARKRGAGIALVILDPAYVAKVQGGAHGAYLKRHIRFMRATPWVRHDEHFHVDFKIACKPLK